VQPLSRAKIEERERRERAGVNAVVGSWPAARGLACGEGLACGIFLWLTGQMGGMMEVFFLFWCEMQQKEMEDGGERNGREAGAEKGEARRRRAQLSFHFVGFSLWCSNFLFLVLVPSFTLVFSFFLFGTFVSL